ncbi:restriction endonuclease subunit S [Flectobacillus roseus]
MSKLKKYKFSELYAMSSGISSKPEQAGHGSPFASFKTIFNNYFLPDELPDLMDTSEKQQETYSIKKGDIFLTRTSETIDELGIGCVALKDYPQATYSGFVKRLRPLQDNITYDKYMGFYLRSKFFRKTMTNNAVLTLRASLNEEIFSYLDLLLPDFDSQKRIGDFLLLLNQKIELNNRINAELEAMAKTLYDYWFVQFDFPNAEGKPYKSSGGAMVWSEELKREIPEGWEVGTLENLGDFKNGINYDPKIKGNSFAKIINVRNISSSNLFISQFELDEIELKESEINNYLVTQKDILIARSGIPGTTRLMNEFETNTIYCGFIIRFQVRKLEDRNYLFFFLKDMEKSTGVKSAGTIMQNVNQDTLKRLLLVLPDKNIIKRFNDFIYPIFEQINTVIKENQQLAQLRDWLLPMLMNGQVVVE